MGAVHHEEHEGHESAKGRAYHRFLLTRQTATPWILNS
jgi:hypothetical protein